MLDIQTPQLRVIFELLHLTHILGVQDQVQEFFLKISPNNLKTNFAAIKSGAINPGTGQSSITSKPTISKFSTI
ncbi:hypothetical protein HYY75_04575 [bacterium]|nr:hypothetical protein [bacterium]